MCIMIMYERLQKFVILTQNSGKTQNLKSIIQFCMRTARYESHKDLGRNLENDLVTLEDCMQCNVLFEDRGSNQLYTISYTADDDFRNTNQNLINMALAKIQKLMVYPRQNAKQIQEIQDRVSEMKRELDLDMSMRNMILNSNQLICIPSDQGLTGLSFGKAKTIYYNNFEGVTQSKFYPETDNLKAYKNISSFIMSPLIGHDGKPNGVLQLYSFKQPITRLQIKKMIAMRKFLGGCLDNVNLNKKNLESVVGAMSKIEGTAESCFQREKEAEAEQRQVLDLQAMVKGALKEIDEWHIRATTVPGFMPPPVVEEDDVNPHLKKFLEQKAAEEAAEAEKEAKMAAMKGQQD